MVCAGSAWLELLSGERVGENEGFLGEGSGWGSAAPSFPMINYCHYEECGCLFCPTAQDSCLYPVSSDVGLVVPVPPTCTVTWLPIQQNGR